MLVVQACTWSCPELTESVRHHTHPLARHTNEAVAPAGHQPRGESWATAQSAATAPWHRRRTSSPKTSAAVRIRKLLRRTHQPQAVPIEGHTDDQAEQTRTRGTTMMPSGQTNWTGSQGAKEHTQREARQRTKSAHGRRQKRHSIGRLKNHREPREGSEAHHTAGQTNTKKAIASEQQQHERSDVPSQRRAAPAGMPEESNQRTTVRSPQWPTRTYKEHQTQQASESANAPRGVTNDWPRKRTGEHEQHQGERHRRVKVDGESTRAKYELPSTRGARRATASKIIGQRTQKGDTTWLRQRSAAYRGQRATPPTSTTGD